MSYRKIAYGLAFGLIGVTGQALADEEAEQMVRDALPVMYHTCASVIDEADGDDEYVLDVVGKITALSIYNRGVDINDYVTSEEDGTKLRDAFLGALAKGCEEDSNALLAGVVDSAVRESLGL